MYLVLSVEDRERKMQTNYAKSMHLRGLATAPDLSNREEWRDDLFIMPRAYRERILMESCERRDLTADRVSVKIVEGED